MRGRRRTHAILPTALAPALAVAACAWAPTQTYPGPQRPRSEIAILRDSANATLVEIDGTRAAGSSWSLLPGDHELLVKFRILTTAPGMRYDLWTYCSVALTAAAGAEYRTLVRFQKEAAPDFQEKVDVEFGVVDASGAWHATPDECGRRPRRES